MVVNGLSPRAQPQDKDYIYTTIISKATGFNYLLWNVLVPVLLVMCSCIAQKGERA